MDKIAQVIGNGTFWSALVEDYLLDPARQADANVFLHVVSDEYEEQVAALSSELSSWLVLAADLAEHRGPREEARAFELVRAWAEQAQP